MRNRVSCPVVYLHGSPLTALESVTVRHYCANPNHPSRRIAEIVRRASAQPLRLVGRSRKVEIYFGDARIFHGEVQSFRLGDSGELVINCQDEESLARRYIASYRSKI